jgi:hypothetical protein
VTSVKELKQRLGEFLADSKSENLFRDWFALVLRDAHRSDAAVEQLAHKIMWAFLDQKRGLCSPKELMDELTRLATDPGVYFGAEPFPVKADTTSTGLQEVPAFVLEGSPIGVGFASVSL